MTSRTGFSHEMVERLHSWSGSQLAQAWLNQVKKLAMPERCSASDLELAREMIRQIGVAWKARRTAPEWKADWLTVSARDPRRRSGATGIEASPDVGLLQTLGYHVGETQPVEKRLRQQILREIFDGELPPVDSPKHMQEWGEPGTEHRMRKLALTLASLNLLSDYGDQKRRLSFRRAIAEREADLQFLHEEYFVGRDFRFTWPIVGG